MATAFQQSYHKIFCLLRGNAPPSPEDQSVYRLGDSFRGFTASEATHLDATFVALMVKVLRAKPGKFHFFVPKTQLVRVMSRVKELSETALRISDPSERKSRQMLMSNALMRVSTDKAPWSVNEPEDWVSFGFTRDPIILPPWFYEKLT